MFTTLLVFHIICGFTALGIGTAISFLKKGNATHKRLGRFFFYAMIGITASALVLSFYKSNLFLLFIALFSFFQALGGRRTIRNQSGKRDAADFLILLFGVVTSLCMIMSMNGLLVFFGVISLGSAIGFARYCFVKRSRNDYQARLKVHIGMMGGSFIATVTAFVVVNFPASAHAFIPQWIPWVFPTFLMAPVMVMWIRKYTVRKVRTV